MYGIIMVTYPALRIMAVGSLPRTASIIARCSRLIKIFNLNREKRMSV